MAEPVSNLPLARAAFEILRCYLGKHDAPVDVNGLRVCLDDGLLEISKAHVPALTDRGQAMINRIVMGAFPKVSGCDD